ncbi:MAG: hypothetical protein U0694_28260 [Anaerolineae bacterium]
MYRPMLMIVALLLIGALPAAAQTATPMPLAETYTTTAGEALTFQYPAGWYVLEAPESIVIADSEATFTRFRENAQAQMQPGMVAISILRPQTLTLGFSLDADTTLDDFAAIVSTQLQGITPEAIELGENPAFRFQYPPQRFDVAAFAFERDGLYFATLAAATGTLSQYEPTARAIFASFVPVDETALELPEIEVDTTLVSEPYAPLLAPLTFEFPETWTISESAFGAIALSNSANDGNVFEPPVAGIVRVQINFTQADELPLGMAGADTRAVLEFTAAADQAVLSLDEPYGEATEFLLGDYRAARTDSVTETSETMLMVVAVEDWFVTFRVAAFADEMADYEPTIMAVAASLILLPELEATAEATATGSP